MERNVPIPEALIQHPCDPVGAGYDIDTLVKGYVSNLSCVGEYKETINGIHSYNAKIIRENDRLVKQTNDGRGTSE